MITILNTLLHNKGTVQVSWLTPLPYYLQTFTLTFIQYPLSLPLQTTSISPIHHEPKKAMLMEDSMAHIQYIFPLALIDSPQHGIFPSNFPKAPFFLL